MTDGRFLFDCVGRIYWIRWKRRTGVEVTLLTSEQAAVQLAQARARRRGGPRTLAAGCAQLGCAAGSPPRLRRTDSPAPRCRPHVWDRSRKT